MTELKPPRVPPNLRSYIKYTYGGRKANGIPCQVAITTTDDTVEPPEVTELFEISWTLTDGEFEIAAKLRGMDERAIEKERRDEYTQILLDRVVLSVFQRGATLIVRGGDLVLIMPEEGEWIEGMLI